MSFHIESKQPATHIEPETRKAQLERLEREERKREAEHYMSLSPEELAHIILTTTPGLFK